MIFCTGAADFLFLLCQRSVLCLAIWKPTTDLTSQSLRFRYAPALRGESPLPHLCRSRDFPLGELSFTVEVKNEFDPTGDTQLRKNLKQVPFDRDRPTLEFSCNLTVREAVSHQANNLLLPLGKQNYSRGGSYTQPGRLDSPHVAPAVSLVLAVLLGNFCSKVNKTLGTLFCLFSVSYRLSTGMRHEVGA